MKQGHCWKTPTRFANHRVRGLLAHYYHVIETNHHLIEILQLVVNSKDGEDNIQRGWFVIV